MKCRLLAMAAVAVLLCIPSRRAASASPATVTVQTVARGVKLALAVPRPRYPENALIRVTVVLQNLTGHAIHLGGENSVGICPRARPVAQVVSDAGTPVPILPGMASTKATCPVYISTLAAHTMIRRQRFVVLRAGHVRAAVMLLWPSSRQEIVTPAANLTLTPGTAPRAVSGGWPLLRANISRPQGWSGPLYYLQEYNCGTPYGAAVGIWTAATPLRDGTYSLWPECRDAVEWHLVAGWLNHPVASIDFVKH